MKNEMLRKRSLFRLWGTLAIAVAVTAAAVFFPVPVRAEIVSTPPYPDWKGMDSEKAYWTKTFYRETLSQDYTNGLREFGVTSAAKVLGSDSGKPTENRLYSPLSLAMAMSMLAETTDGDTRTEVLTALNAGGIEALRENTGKLFCLLESENDNGKLHLANSVWLSKDLPFREEAANRLASDYFAYSMSTDFKSGEAGKEIGGFISENTGGLLGGDTFEVDQATAAMLLNTVYFKNQWSSKFDEKNTKDAAFTLADGAKVTVPFMNKTAEGGFTDGDGYVRAQLSFADGSVMKLILPDKGITPEKILSDPAFLKRALYETNDKVTVKSDIVYRLPKFEYGTKMNLNKSLKAMGVNQAFDSKYADFSPLSELPMVVDTVQQEARISVNENGAEAAAYTAVMIRTTGAIIEETLPKRELNLNRPFLYTIETPSYNNFDGIPLFIGVIGNPSAK